MERRLYFLFPDTLRLRAALVDLAETRIPAENCHAIGRELPDDLPHATRRQLEDIGARMERTGWYLNLGIFGVAAIGLIAALFASSLVGAIIALAVMAITFGLGNFWTQKIPHTHLDAFREAIQHGEYLLMVDVAPSQVAEIEQLMERRHPEAVNGGVGWHSALLGT